MVVSQFKEIHFPDLYISTSQGNNCYLINDNVGIIRNIVVTDGTEMFIVHEQFTNVTNFFQSPVAIFRPKNKTCCTTEWDTVCC